MSKAESPDIKSYYSLPSEKVLQLLKSRPSGLTEDEVISNQKEYGLNEIREARGKPLSHRFFISITHPMAILLWIASIMAYAGKMPELTLAIVVVIIINGVFSFWQEYRAERTSKELKKLIPQNARVIREGQEKQIPATDIVPGDIIILSEGDKIPADGRIIKNFQILTDESTLTGESRPINKISQQVASTKFKAIHDIPNLIFSGSNVVSGTGIAVVFATGMKTQFGRLAHLTETISEEPSPLQKELKKVTFTVSTVAVFLGVLIFLTGFSLGIGAAESFLFAIGMIVANVPEGLLPTVTLSLAMGMQRMAKRGAIIKKLSSVETLGCTTVICTDKTGTLTCNEMTVTKIWTRRLNIKVSGAGYKPQGELTSDDTDSPIEARSDVQELLNGGMLCNNARLLPPSDQKTEWRILGDPTEGAILVTAIKAGLDYPSKLNRITLIPFDSKRKRMSVVIDYNNKYFSKAKENNHLKSYVKGAPIELLSLCDSILDNNKVVAIQESDRILIRKQIDIYAKEGLRVLGIASKDIKKNTDKLSVETIEKELTFLGLVAMMDPPRSEVEEAIRKCQNAGINVLMLTGDYGLTAEVIARRLGIISGKAKIVTGDDIEGISDENLQKVLQKENIVFARISPEHKLRIVMALQALNHVVAMTGDGVNDAPALKRADIGVAMGISGTDVAKEAASMIITDDNFASIVSAIEEGRAVYNNIKKFTRYIFASNVPEIVPFIFFALAQVPLALNVMQILSVDLGTDMLPALALGAEPAEKDVMNMPPRKREKSLLSRELLAHAFLFLGTIEAFAAMGSYYWMNLINGYGPHSLAQPGNIVYTMASTMTLVGIVMVQVGNVFACRTERSSSLQRSIRINPLLPIGILFEILLIIALVYLPFLQPIFGTASLLPQHWLFPIIFAPTILLADELRKFIYRRNNLNPLSHDKEENK
ncbi:cation-translocating P-type ATPase [[Eubacterium] cellulosolvens]